MSDATYGEEVTILDVDLPDDKKAFADVAVQANGVACCHMNLQTRVVSTNI